jgi:hypothetical protein
MNDAEAVVDPYLSRGVTGDKTDRVIVKTD